MKKKYKTLIILSTILLFSLNSCTTQGVYKYYIPNNNKTAEKHKKKHTVKHSACRKQESYIPNAEHLDHTPKRTIRLNFHWIIDPSIPMTYTEEDVINYATGLVKFANEDLENNQQMWLPPNNTTPVLPPLYEYVITPTNYLPDDDGIYFHHSKELSRYVDRGKNSNIFSRTLIDSFGIQLDTILNVFLLQHHPDSIKSPTYPNYDTGVALRNAIKLGGITPNYQPLGRKSSLNHEVGHIFGLSHTWAFNDGCDDTPKHSGDCYTRDVRPECDTMATNNIMDYSSTRTALTPCQIGRVHKRMSSHTYKRQRSYLAPTWCTLKEDKHIYIKDNIDWECHKDIEGHITIEKGGQLQLFCRLSLPKGAIITVKAGGKLILNGCRLHNDCGEEWKGIRIEEKNGITGNVEIIGDVMIENASESIPSIKP